MKINIAYAPDNNFVNSAIVSMSSVLENNKNNEIEFIILYSNLEEESIKKFNLLKIYKNYKIRFVKVDEEIFKSFPEAYWVTVQTWFRTALGDLCPDLDRILYLDCDTLVLGDLSELFTLDLSYNLVAGVTDCVRQEKHVKRLNILDKKYFNAGILLLNTRLIREENMFEKIKEYAVGKKLPCADQDAINKVADNKKLLLHPKYNYLETWYANNKNDYDKEYSKLYSQAKDNPVIIHFVGLKPFFYKNLHSRKFQWWKFAQKINLISSLKENFLEEEKQFKIDNEGVNKFHYFIAYIISKFMPLQGLRRKIKQKLENEEMFLCADKYFAVNNKIKELF